MRVCYFTVGGSYCSITAIDDILLLYTHVFTTTKSLHFGGFFGGSYCSDQKDEYLYNTLAILNKST